ncbi:MAG TPA: hypothetical protein VJS89_06870 [Gammaproteobacteria bacterium]|nr:hypothetical protein [Gammaproteobacteria bacterium]
MLRIAIAGAFTVIMLAGCASIEQSMGRLTVKSYTAKSGERVMAGQAEPRSEYGCSKVSQETADFGLSGNMDKTTATEKITAVAVNTAPSKGANYAYIIIPGETSVMGFNVNAFKDAQVAYYKCASLPAA